MDRSEYSSGYYDPARGPAPSMASTAVPTPRPSTPNDRSEMADSQASQRSGINPFASPSASRPTSSYGSSSALGNRFDERASRYFHSRRVRKGEVEKPWTKNKDPKEKWVTILPIMGIFLGAAISGFLIWDGLRSVVKHNYCIVLDENFSEGINTDTWTPEIQVGGFGNGEFEQATDSTDNLYVEGGHLFIKATPQDDSLINQNSVINLGKTGAGSTGTCTGTSFLDCYAATNVTNGNSTIVPPAKSARITTKNSKSIKYGRVEVTAKMPVGDWLWPAIWMMPLNDTYGPWPASGEIDILESRGNNYTYAQGGNNIASSAMHWGPDPADDAWWRTNSKRPALHTTYSAGFNTFGLEWSQKYLFTYINSRLLQVLYNPFDQYQWPRGNYPISTANGTRLQDIWSQTGRFNTPFDQPFYLILNVAVGGTNGWFQDGQSGKPWLDNSPKAKKDFWDAKDQWLPTWTQPQMEVSKVQMWQQCDGNEDST